VSDSPDAVVIGAGIVGAACAEALSRDGASVVLLDSRFTGAGATSAGMGHLVVMDDSEAQLALTSYSRGLWLERFRELPRECEPDRCGTLWIAEDDAQMESLRSRCETFRARGLAAEVVDGEELARMEPRLRRGLSGALRVADDAVIYPPAAARFLADRAREQGAVVRSGARVEAVGEGFVLFGGQTIRAGSVVLAAGAESVLLIPELPIVPRKGHLVITDRYPGYCRHELVELGYLKSAHSIGADSVAFNVQPRATGQLLVGSSRQLAGWNTNVDRSIVRKMIARARDFLPDLGRLSALRVWTGFRPATPDKLPLVGAWPRIRGMWIAAGHEGLGITTATGTARLLADLIGRRPPAIDPAPYRPDRPIPEAA